MKITGKLCLYCIYGGHNKTKGKWMEKSRGGESAEGDCTNKFLSFIGSINYLAMSRKWNCIDDEISRMIKRFAFPQLCKNDHKRRQKLGE